MKRDIFSELMDGLEALAEERKGKVTLKKTRAQRIGTMKGKLTLPNDIDTSLPEDWLDTFER
ncbi:DUF2281 domain-containing protein [Pseudomonas kribbensis]|jgi:hypothetical protein|uniref:DUF2281 domain-containing protein n=1 Tax=Pseudomonas TaxID=286 RepID=UPI00200D050F|nr:DUF2281 domain-containing protein [Pseudomonas sp. A29(2023)]MDL5593912.1 DUF2281 domain-containing protein [Bacillus subtilis]